MIDPNIYNGEVRIQMANKNFMTREKVMQAMKDLKIKNCEGSDLIPQRILIEGIDILHSPFSALFNMF